MSHLTDLVLITSTTVGGVYERRLPCATNEEESNNRGSAAPIDDSSNHAASATPVLMMGEDHEKDVLKAKAAQDRVLRLPAWGDTTTATAASVENLGFVREHGRRGTELAVQHHPCEAGLPAVQSGDADSHRAVCTPHRVRLIWFLILSVVTAALAVTTPLLAGQVINAITGSADVDVVVGLAALIALIAVADAGFSILGRWLSSRIGEGLILDLRTAVFDHVQKMPIAFFTRTRTGALVSRLNNDVIGAQRAFSGTLSGVVGNLVMVVLTLIAMLSLSWQVTLLALVLLPIFVVPARRMGSRLAGLQREAANHNAAMGDQMTERFSAPGATLIKLFGRPEEESAEFEKRAQRVQDIGVKTAMLQSTFITALTLVSALALALVYGLGGVYAIVGELQAGAVVSLALLLTRLYAPLTSLASARVEVMSAVVSFERVFEVLDLEPLITEKEDAKPVLSGPCIRGVRGGHLLLPLR